MGQVALRSPSARRASSSRRLLDPELQEDFSGGATLQALHHDSEPLMVAQTEEKMGVIEERLHRKDVHSYLPSGGSERIENEFPERAVEERLAPLRGE